jgi:hypothetical protein
MPANAALSAAFMLLLVLVLVLVLPASCVYTAM